MSGIFGIITPTNPDKVEQLLPHMADLISHRPWQQTDTFIDNRLGIGLGRLHIGIFNTEKQPITNDDHTITLFMAGEIYQIESAVDLSAMENDAQKALRLYEILGPEFVKSLNGVFIIAIWDQTEQRLLIANDRFGLYPLFYSYRSGELIFAPEMKAILCDPAFPGRLDMVALAQYIRFQHLLGERTFFEDLALLPPATILTYDRNTGICHISPYWSFANIAHYPNIDFPTAVEEAGRLFKKAVTRLSGDQYQTGIYLSGGLDSRAIVGFVEQFPVSTLSYGRKTCRDVHYANQIAKAVGSDHYWVDLPNANWVTEQVDFHLTLTEGYHSWIHAHGMNTLPLARHVMQVNLTGWDGGTVMGHKDSIEPEQLYAVSDLTLTNRLFKLFNQHYTWPSTTEAEESQLYQPAIRANLRGVAFDSLQHELAPYLGLRPDVRGEYFYIHNHCRRLTHNMVTFTRSHVEVRFPFFDYDLFDFLYSIPATIRGDKKLYRTMLQSYLPHLVNIPSDKDNLPPTTKWWRQIPYKLLNATRERTYQLLDILSNDLPPIPTMRHREHPVWRKFLLDRHTLYADYENYLRTELRFWAEGILFADRTTQRGLFNSDYLRALMKHHQAGLEEWTIGKIAPLITYEMMLRRFYD